MTNSRDDFSPKVKKLVADRAGYRCSNPNCKKVTTGPNSNPNKATNIGVAAHITAASPGGKRYDASLTVEQRTSIDNAIWLCQSCGTLVDRDSQLFSVILLRNWKSQAENEALTQLNASKFRPITPNELRQEFTIAQLVAFKALTEEFGCYIKTDVSIPTDDGWVNFHGAVVRKEDIIAIEIEENKNSGFRYYHIEYLVQLSNKLKIPRFQNFVLYIVVISETSEESDQLVREKLEQITSNALCEIHIRMYRLNSLRAKYNL